MSLVPRVNPDRLGCAAFRERHHLAFAYVTGAMYKAIASADLVIRMARAGCLGFYGAGGVGEEQLERDLCRLGETLGQGDGRRGVYGVNLLASPFQPEVEERQVDLFLRHGVERVEASAFTQVTPALVRFRLTGLEAGADGAPRPRRLVMAKLSRPEVAEAFLAPAPDAIVTRLLSAGVITRQQAELSRHLPMADDLCVEADSGGHTDQGVLHVLLPVIAGLRDRLSRQYGYKARVSIGAAGGLGTPEAMAAALVLGADFLLTGSINQCTVEAGTSDAVKDLLQSARAQDMELVPAGDLFESGARVQVFRKGLLFPARARKLYDLYRFYPSLEAIDAATRQQLETRYFKRSLDEVYEETRAYYLRKNLPEVIAAAERSPKQKMALIFRWYFVHTTRLALRGESGAHVDYQIHSGPALGAFNALVEGTPLAPWRERHVDGIALFLLQQTAGILEKRMRTYFPQEPSLASTRSLHPL